MLRAPFLRINNYIFKLSCFLTQSGYTKGTGDNISSVGFSGVFMEFNIWSRLSLRKYDPIFALVHEIIQTICFFYGYLFSKFKTEGSNSISISDF